MPNDTLKPTVQVLFFAQLRERAGTNAETLPFVEGETVDDLLQRLYRLHPALENWDRQILVGVGVEFVRRDAILRPGDEVAVMPPVQGG